MRKWILMAFLLIGLMVLLTGTAVADNGPHLGEYGTTTDACAGCHRAHRGKAEKLLAETSQQALCFSCHGSTATGADTNVEDGVYENRASGGDYGTVGAGLRGGGFAYAKMDPDMNGSVISATVTSKHNVGEVGTIWGNGNAGSGAGKTGVTLECGSCHNPHGFADQDRYRILRPIPEDSDATTQVNVDDEGTKVYTVQYWVDSGGHEPGGQTFLQYYRDLRANHWMADGRDLQLAEWCAQCHTRYLADDFSELQGEDIFKYRHATHVQIGAGNANILVCQACHVAHGTSATMAGTYSGSVEWPDDNAGGGNSDSRLLHVNNRGVCVQCHVEPGENKGCLQCHNP
jgi:predicted CXXCH cytochrome family protein